MKHLLFYKPNEVIREEHMNRPGIKNFSHFFKIYNPAITVIDRSNTISTPIHTTSLFPLPAVRPLTSTFEELCNARAQELLKQADTLGVTLYTFWSGGIDSTLLLISLLKNATPAQRDNIVVLLSEDSIQEYELFFREHIDGVLRVDSSNMFPYLLGSEHILVNGEHNDQLFGSDIVAKFIARFGEAFPHQHYNPDNFFTLFNETLGDEDAARFYVRLFEKLKGGAPVPIVSNYDFLWWINFSLKWQTVSFRQLPFTAERNIEKISREYITSRFVRFYNTDDFQIWSMTNPDKKIKDSWKTYKWVCKDIIYDYTKDADYRDNKIKKGSLHSLLLQQKSYKFIDDSFSFYQKLDFEEYYNPDSDFV